MKTLIKFLLQQFGYEIVRKGSRKNLPPDFDGISGEIINYVTPYTMTSIERINSLINATKYIIENNIEGDFVECGVWKGGSMMAVAHTLNHFQCNYRDLYLFDTFEGMSDPTQDDVDFSGLDAKTLLDTNDKNSSLIWCYSTLDEVKKNLEKTGYSREKIHFIQGKVEDTIPLSAPQKIALLRLDTDWYESTKHELVHLFPRLVNGGVLIVDDYGYWQGCRKAVDEYIRDNGISILLNRIDFTGRIAVKVQVK
jgi:O-methyltransferase